MVFPRCKLSTTSLFVSHNGHTSTKATALSRHDLHLSKSSRLRSYLTHRKVITCCFHLGVTSPSGAEGHRLFQDFISAHTHTLLRARATMPGHQVSSTQYLGAHTAAELERTCSSPSGSTQCASANGSAARASAGVPSSPTPS